MISARVLLISDDPDSAQIWSFALRQSEIETVVMAPPEKDDTERRPDLNFEIIVIDVHAPHLSTAALIRRVREDATIPILLLLPRYDEPAMLDAYQAGADEVIAEPVSFRLLVAKVMAWLRRSFTVPTSLLDSLQVGDLRLDPAQRQLSSTSGLAVRLTGLEFRLVHLLMSHAGRILDSQLMIDRIWGAYGGDTTLLKNLVYRVRRKIEPDPTQPTYIQVVAGEGYVFVPADPDASSA